MTINTNSPRSDRQLYDYDTFTLSGSIGSHCFRFRRIARCAALWWQPLGDQRPSLVASFVSWHFLWGSVGVPWSTGAAFDYSRSCLWRRWGRFGHGQRWPRGSGTARCSHLPRAAPCVARPTASRRRFYLVLTSTSTCFPGAPSSSAEPFFRRGSAQSSADSIFGSLGAARPGAHGMCPPLARGWRRLGRRAVSLRARRTQCRSTTGTSSSSRPTSFWLRQA